ncbi:hypothetical protein J1TS5_03710 [Paenibacillus macerans]|uniref:hypothetical protein n=1 Tax=Paenibacillus macerans TaxID=44252 RepID=UPI001B264FBC|nr:hypothetical protein [Paenibacillus macerans]GIP08201.1 hypothetical protein J1TS5_03710 [Paenibacillus macerans]
MTSPNLISLIEEHYGTDLLDNFEILRLDDNRLVVKCGYTGIKVAIIWDDVIKSIKNSYTLERLKSKNGVEKISYLLLYLHRYDYGLSNNMYFLDDCGFYSNGLAEFLINYDSLEYQYDIDLPGLTNFMIGKTYIRVQEPSNLYKFIFHHFTIDDNFADWNNYRTLSVEGVEKAKLEEIIQHSLYILAKYNPSILVGDYPEIVTYMYEDDPWEDSVTYEEGEYPEEFEEPNYYEAIAFYNKGRQTNDELYYYKVIEYFFIINRKEEIRTIIGAYNENSNLNSLIDSITKIYDTKEKILLENLLNNLIGIEYFINLAHDKQLIDSKEIGHFSQKLYDYRNSIVHGKKDTKLELIVPTTLEENKRHGWNLILKGLAEKVIQQFC